jgi:hypothetical protein
MATLSLKPLKPRYLAILYRGRRNLGIGYHEVAVGRAYVVIYLSMAISIYSAHRTPQ